MDGWGRPESIGGHEYSGRIAALGSEVSGWEIGEAVVGGPLPGCGSCAYCRSRRPGLCVSRADPAMADFQGAFADFVKVHESQLLRVPDGISLRDAALAEALAVALHGITLSGIRPGGRALISGAGPIGALTLAVLRARGIDDVTLSEPLPVRRELAAKLGASRVLEPDDLRAPPLPLMLVEQPFDVAFECSGKPAAFEAALAQLDRAGTLVILGTGLDPPGLDPNRMLLNELVVTGAYAYDEDGIADALELLASGRLPTRLLVESPDVPLEGLLEAMQGLVGGRIAGKVLVAP
jgi:threonine dehydrogenase-like Zn-dependent dehydrogenase